MNHELPPRRNLESLKKEAKRWLGALQAGDPDARARLARAFPDAPGMPTLRDVQHALAREHGFAGWTSLKEALDKRAAEVADAGATTLALYEAKAEALLEAYRTGTPEAMERHYAYTWHRRAWRAMRTYVQLDLGKRSADPNDDVAISVDDARLLIALEHGCADWRELEASTKSVKSDRRVTSKPLQLVVQKGPEQWEPIAGSREWAEVLELLDQHPTAGLGGQGQMTDDLLEDLSHRARGLTALGLSGCKQVTDAGVLHLARVPSLQHLDLTGTSVTDTGLQVLRHLPQLRTLSLARNRVTDAGIGVLAHCDQLAHLNLGDSAQIGDAAIRALANKRKLRHLAIALTDAGLPWLRELPAFKAWQGGEAELGLVGHKSLPTHLSLRGTFMDAGMRLRNLSYYFNSYTMVSDRTPELLSTMDSLERIAFDTCHGLTNSGIARLARLPKLRELRVSGRGVTSEICATFPPRVEVLCGQ